MDEKLGRIAMWYAQNCRDCILLACGILHDQARAEDAVHSAFVSVLEHKETYARLPDADFRRLLLVIVKNKCLDILRRERRFAPLEPRLESPDAGPETLALQRMEEARVWRALEGLDVRSQEVLMLKYALGLSYREISRITGAKEKAVEMRLARARQRLRTRLEEDDG